MGKPHIPKGIIEAARREYLTGACTSLTELSKRYGIPYKTLESRHYREQWKAKLAQSQMQAFECIEQGESASTADLALQYRANAHQFLAGGAGLVDELLQDARTLRPLARSTIADYRELVGAVAALLATGKSHFMFDRPQAAAAPGVQILIPGELERVCGLLDDLSSAPEPAALPPVERDRQA